jgi:hypothetical protein
LLAPVAGIAHPPVCHELIITDLRPGSMFGAQGD